MAGRKMSQILGLDLIRCAAAVLVMFYHYCCYLPVWFWGYSREPFEPTISYRALQPYTWFGWVGVEIFFVISGFVIAYSSREATPKGFLKSRFLRLFPTLWICSTISFVVVLLFGHVRTGFLISEWLHSLVLAPWTHYWVDGSYWTLPIEISFYAIVFLLLATGQYRHLGTAVSFVGLTSAAISIYQQAVVLGFLWHLPFADKLVQIAANTFLAVTSLRYGLYFALGTGLWLFLFDRRSLLRAVMLGIFTLGAVAEMRWHTQEFTAMMQAHHADNAGRLSSALPAVVWAVALIAIIASVVAKAPIARLLGHTGARVTRKLGLATYPIYLLHQAIGQVAIERLHSHLPDIVSLVLVVSVITAFCLGALPRIEEPLQRKLRTLLEGFK